MPEYSASLAPTLSSIATYVGQTATPNQQVTCSIGVQNMPQDVVGPIASTPLQSTDGSFTNKYSSAPTATVTSVNYANYVWLIGLRGNASGKMVYARIDIQAKMRFRQTCYSYNREPLFIRTDQYGSGYYVWSYYYSVIEWPTTRLDVYANYQIYTVTENNYAKPGYLFNGGTLKVSTPTYNNYGGSFVPFGTYVFRTVPLSAGTRYQLFAPNQVVGGANATAIAQWDNLDGSFPYDDTFTQVSIGMCANGSFSPTLDNWTAKDI